MKKKTLVEVKASILRLLPVYYTGREQKMNADISHFIQNQYKT